MDYLSSLLPLPWFHSVYWEIRLLLNGHVFSIFPAITNFMFSPKYFLSHQSEVPGFEPGGSHILVISIFMMGRFLALIQVG